MKKFLSVFCGILILFQFFILPQNVSAAGSCPNGYTYINITTPTNSSYLVLDLFQDQRPSLKLMSINYANNSLYNFGYIGEYCYLPTQSTHNNGTYGVNSYSNGRETYRWNSGTWGSSSTYSGNAPLLYEFLIQKANFQTTFSNVIFPNYINSNNVSNVGVTISGITDSDSGQTLTYKYQLNGGIWNDVGTGGTPKSNFDYTFTLDATSWPEGNNTISFKVNDGFSDSNVITKNITKDTILPVLSSGSISSLTNDPTPNFSFFTTEAGTIAYSGVCNSNSNTIAGSGNLDITLNALVDGTYNSCSIRVQDAAGNLSNILAIPTFTIDTTPPLVPTSVKVNNGAEFTNNKSLNLEILHPNESDVDGWCTTEDTFNECIWQNSKPNTYQLKD